MLLGVQELDDIMLDQHAAAVAVVAETVPNTRTEAATTARTTFEFLFM